MARKQRLGRLLAAGILVGAFAGTVPAVAGQSASAAGPSCPSLGGFTSTPNTPATQLTQTQSFTPPGGNPVIVCSARVPSFDGTPIHLDLTLPSASYTPKAKPQSLPLIILHSGWSDDVCQFEATSFDGSTTPSSCPRGSGYPGYIGNGGYHWNNAWFASHGFAVLTYTPRGWYDSCGQDPANSYSYQTDPACTGHTFSDPNCPGTESQQSWIHLYDRRWEIRDAQYLAGLIVDSGFVDPASGLGISPSKIVISGDSGGGGPSWDLALSRDKVLEWCDDQTSQPEVHTSWTSPTGRALHLRAAIPMFTWTDILDALLPNGTASDGFYGAPPDGSHFSPVGVEKQSYVSGLYALGQKNAQYAPSGSDPDINKWYTDVTTGEPYAANPDFDQIVGETASALRSPFYIPVPTTRQKPIFSIQGFTDPLFPATQTLTEINQLQFTNPSYPVWAFFGDLGHSYARNPAAVWQQAHNESNSWLNAELTNNSTALAAIPRITADTTQCDGAAPTTYTSSSFGSIGNGTLSFTSSPAQNTVSSNAPTTEGTESDPIANSTFCNATTATDANQATYTFSVPSASTIVGGPTVSVTAVLTGTGPFGADAELAARLWDVSSTGQSLISRTVNRLEGVAGQAQVTLNLNFELPANAWRLVCGHTLKLELTQDDSPTFRPDNEQSSLALSNLSLSVPVVTGTTCSGL